MDEKEYQPGVWYGMDVEVPYSEAYTGNEFLVCVFDKLLKKEHFDIARYEHRENVWPDARRCRCFDDMRFYVKSWMLIPEPPKG